MSQIEETKIQIDQLTRQATIERITVSKACEE